MKEDRGSGLRRLFPPRRRVDEGRDEPPPSEASEGFDELAQEFTVEELREFLDGDSYPIEADPNFQERLREKLWELVQERYGSPVHDDELSD